MDRIPEDADGHSLLSLSTPLGERSFGRELGARRETGLVRWSRGSHVYAPRSPFVMAGLVPAIHTATHP